MTSEQENKKIEYFFGSEYSSLRAFVSSRIRASKEWDLDDIIQDVALKLFSRADRFLAINNVLGLVYHSIKNKIIDVVRKRRNSNSNEDENEIKLIEFTELLYGKSDNSYSERMKDALKKAIIELKPS